MLEKGFTIGEHLKFHRLSANLTQNELAKIVGLSNGACIKDIEIGKKLPGRETSKKLAEYFNLDSKYFYDPYLEDTDNLNLILKEYRSKNNLTIRQAANKFNVAPSAWSTWENKIAYVSRNKYVELKKLGLI